MNDLESILSRIDDCNKISSHCKKHNLAVQAGSHIGLYPERLSNIFDKVITFEADIENYEKYVNVSNNVEKIYGVLGDGDGYAGINRIPGHSGQSFINKTGNIPIKTIDGLSLDCCDLIYLDIEGYELMALRGAVETIRKFKPIIAMENKKMIRIRGFGRMGQINVFMAGIGYKKIAKYHLDEVYSFS